MAKLTHEGTVLPAWIDRNGHMNLAYYIVLFDAATDAVFDWLGIGADYTDRTGNTMFAVEAHTLYQREVTLGEQVRIMSTVVGGDAKRLHLAHEMFRADGSRAATFETMNLHVGMQSRRVVLFPPDRAATIAAEVSTPPDFVGRRIALPG